MAWAAQFQWIQGQTAPSEALEISCPATKMRIGEEVNRPYKTKDCRSSSQHIDLCIYALCPGSAPGRVNLKPKILSD